MMLLIFSIIVVYPVMLYPAFIIFDFHFFSNGNNKIFKQNLFRTFAVVGTILIGIASIGKFDTLLALVGSVLCTPLAVIFPSMFHFLIFRKIQSNFRNMIDLLMFGVGCSISLVVFTFTVIF